MDPDLALDSTWTMNYMKFLWRYHCFGNFKRIGIQRRIRRLYGTSTESWSLSLIHSSSVCSDPMLIWICIQLLPQCGARSGSGSRELNQCGSLRIQIQILVRLCRHKKLDFDMKNILYVCNGNMSLNIPYLRYWGIKAILKGWKLGLFVNFGHLLLDPDLYNHSPYGSGSEALYSSSLVNKFTVHWVLRGTHLLRFQSPKVCRGDKEIWLQKIRF